MVRAPEGPTKEGVRESGALSDAVLLGPLEGIDGTRSLWPPVLLQGEHREHLFRAADLARPVARNRAAQPCVTETFQDASSPNLEGPFT